MPASYKETIRADILRWLETVRYKREGWGKYPFHDRTTVPYSLVASGWAIRMLDDLDMLAAISDSDKNDAGAYLIQSQDRDDGYFKDRFEDVSVYTGFHSWEEVWNSRSSVVHALHILGFSPAVPLPSRRFADPVPDGYVRWLDGLNWENPGKCGEMMSSALIAYAQSLDPSLRLDHLEPFAGAFDYLEENVLGSSTGLPDRLGTHGPVSLINGLARIQSAYIYFGRSFPLAARVIDYILDSQDQDGTFEGESRTAINCHYHALSVLRELNYQLEGSHRVEDIQACGNQTAHYLLDGHRKPDGGFSCFTDSCQDTNCSIRLGGSYPISDMQAGWMAVRCMRFTDEWNAGIIFGRKRRPFVY